MAAAIALRRDFDAPALRKLEKSSKAAARARRLPAPAGITDGSSRTGAARIGAVTLESCVPLDMLGGCCASTLRHGRDGAAPGRGQPGRGAAGSRRAADRPSRLARHAQAEGAGQHHACALAGSCPGVERDGECGGELVRDPFLSNRIFAS